MNNGDYNYAEAFRKMMFYKEHHRPIEDIVAELQHELSPVTEESLLIHAMRMILELEYRTVSPLYQHLQSPMRQTLYLMDVYYSISDREELVEMDAERWNRIALLLDEIEMTYFINIGFPNNGDLFHDHRDEQVGVALATFMGYFGNALMSYEEQTHDRIIRYLKPYDSYIQSHYGFTVDEALLFILHVRQLNNDKLNDTLKSFTDPFSFYISHPEEWRKLTQKFIDRGVTDPHEWKNQPELNGMLKVLTKNPGEIHIHSRDALSDVDIDGDVLQRLLAFFSYDKQSIQGKTVYYAGKHHSESHPLIQLDDRYLCPINKFLLEGMFYRIDNDLMRDQELGQKYKQDKDKAFEKKVEELFRCFFPPNTKIFTNYSVDGVAENDLLVVIGDICIVVEIKNCGFRESFRDPIKSFPRIKKDYSKAIQLGYEQCKRVEDVLLSGNDVDILDASNMKKVLYHLKSKNIRAVWSIVVTDFKYGMIQTDLASLLDKDEDSLYPWSVCVDDIEAFFLLMRKMLKGIASHRFVEFLEYRERLHGHVLCSDELEICGWYLNDREQFKGCADMASLINTSPNMGTIFDAYYRVGLGFKNEFDIAYKKHYSIPDYPREFSLKSISVDSDL